MGKEDNGDGRRGSGGDEGHGGNVRLGPELGQILRRCRDAKTGLDAVLEPHPGGRAAQAAASSSALGATPPCLVRALATGDCPLRAVVGERERGSGGRGGTGEQGQGGRRDNQIRESVG